MGRKGRRAFLVAEIVQRAENSVRGGSLGGAGETQGAGNSGAVWDLALTALLPLPPHTSPEYDLRGWGCCSVVECLLSICEALGFSASTAKKKKRVDPSSTSLS
jgi:hypothetical protein